MKIIYELEELDDDSRLRRLHSLGREEVAAADATGDSAVGPSQAPKEVVQNLMRSVRDVVKSENYVRVRYNGSQEETRKRKVFSNKNRGEGNASSFIFAKALD